MRNIRAVWRLSVSTSAEAEEAVAELLAATYHEPASAYTDVETGATTVSCYLPAKPPWTTSARSALSSALGSIRACGLDPGPGRASLSRIGRAEWAESWKRHFKPLAIGAKLLIRPSWNQRRPRKGQSLIVLDPGLSFGTGQHPTTGFCLRQLASRRRPDRAQSFLDLGTGSGILAIAAAKLGYAPVQALDFDPEAVRIAQSNAQRNGVAKRIVFRQQDVTKLPRQPKLRYSVVCANLISSLLLAERERIRASVQPGGALVLAGILASEFDQVQQAYEAAGFRLAASRTEKEWRSGAFTAPGRCN